jgi:hypothetical protein
LVFLEFRRIVWLGDLNYRINLSYEKTHELISRQDWNKLFAFDQVSFYQHCKMPLFSLVATHHSIISMIAESGAEEGTSI